MQKRSARIAIGFLAIALATAVSFYAQKPGTTGTPMPQVVSFRILLGIGDNDPTEWDGKVKLSEGTVKSIQGWRFAENDSTDYTSAWTVSTHAAAPSAAQRQRGLPHGTVIENGVIISATGVTPQSKYTIETKQGNFSFLAPEIQYGESKSVLNGRVQVDRVPPTLQLTTSAEEEDFPVVAQTPDELYLAFIEFTHGDRSQEINGVIRKEPANFDFLARPVGGDQVMLMRYDKAARTWTEPEPVTETHQDCMRVAMAIDGRRRVWVIWSANKNGNFDIYAKYWQKAKWSSEIRLTSDAGADLNPVAAADSTGRVWVAWQAYRNGNLEVLAAAQDGDKFTAEKRISFSPASDWDPSIAAAPNGEVAVAWDTYDKGDYDVYFRRLRFSEKEIAMDAPVPVAASQGFEARSSIAYDPQNRLWIAYEASDAKWGKAYGAYNTSGNPLYLNHIVRVKCFEGQNVLVTPDDPADLLMKLPHALDEMGRRRRLQTPPPPQLPDAALARNRKPNAEPQPGFTPHYSFPRMTVDLYGIVYLAYRSSPGARSPIGVAWQENVVYFDGEKWIGPLDVPHTDGLLDARSALAPIGGAHLLMVTTSDHRLSMSPGRGRDQVNADLYAAEIQLDLLPKSAKMKAAPAETVAPPDPDAAVEKEQVKAMRDYRVKLGTATYQVLRGDMHRHTDISNNGGQDGPLTDAYRYLIDAASMDWAGCCDHDNGGGLEYFWWLEQKVADAYHLGDAFVPMFADERSIAYPDGHRNILFAKRGIRPLPRFARQPEGTPPGPSPDTQMLYKFLRQFGGIAASHASATDQGTDWRDNDPEVEPVVEIYEGERQNYEMPGAPRSSSEKDAIGGWRPLGFVSLALQKGYRLGFEASSDHVSTHTAFCNLWVTKPTREGIMEAFHARRVYAATDNILADVRCGEHFMGEEFSTSETPVIQVKLRGTGNFAKVHIIKDGTDVYTTEPGTNNVDFTWKDDAAVKGKTSYYYVRGEQANGEMVWASPMWIKCE